MAGDLGDFLQLLEAGATSLGNRRKTSDGPNIWRRNYTSGETIVDWDEKKQAFLFVASGWVASGKVLTNGTRIVLDFPLAGDVITIGSTEWAREIITALSPVTIFELPGAPIENLLSYPRPISQPILRAIARRNARTAEHMASLGRRGAVERTAHLLLELACRVQGRAEMAKAKFSCPLTQSDLADALGLTAVHVNRVLKELREKGLVSFRNGIVEIHDVDRLASFVGFDPSYLSLASE